MDAHDEMISALRGDEPADAQSRAGEAGANLTDKLAAALLCPNCPNQGWYAVPNHLTEEIEQVQCEFCHTEQNSVFNIVHKAANAKLTSGALTAPKQE